MGSSAARLLHTLPFSLLSPLLADRERRAELRRMMYKCFSDGAMQQDARLQTNNDDAPTIINNLEGTDDF